MSGVPEAATLIHDGEDDGGLDATRRRLIVATSAVGGMAVAAAAIPFVASMAPSARARAAGAPVEADAARLAPGEIATVEWRGKPVWILHRTPEMIESLHRNTEQLLDPRSVRPQQPEYCRNDLRSIRPEYWVALALYAPGVHSDRSQGGGTGRSGPIGLAAIIAPATARNSISPEGSIETFLRHQPGNSQAQISLGNPPADRRRRDRWARVKTLPMEKLLSRQAASIDTMEGKARTVAVLPGTYRRQVWLAGGVL